MCGHAFYLIYCHTNTPLMGRGIVFPPLMVCLHLLAIFKSAELFLFFCKCRNGFSNVSGTYDAALCGRFL